MLDNSNDLLIHSKRYYEQFLENVLSSLNNAFHTTLSDSRAICLEQCYYRAITLSSWRQILETLGEFRCQEIYDEIQSDLSASITSALVGNYRLALMSIRSFIELSTLFSYYYYHNVEYQWWIKDKHVIKFSELNQSYFKQYEQLNSYNINDHIYQEWKKVSKYVHAEFKSYMQAAEGLPFLPVYQKGKLGQWMTHFSKAIICINKLFYIILQDEYYTAYNRIELHDSCEIIRQNLRDDALFLSIQKVRSLNKED